MIKNAAEARVSRELRKSILEAASAELLQEATPQDKEFLLKLGAKVFVGDCLVGMDPADWPPISSILEGARKHLKLRQQVKS